MLSSANDLTFEYHNELNPLIWEGDVLKPEIKDKLFQIAEAFLEFIEIPVDIEDITMTGSLANYNYTEYSDIDLHIITDSREYKIDKTLLLDYFKAKKTIWNSSHEIKIKGYDVEVYIQDILEPHHSTGVYSIKSDTWLVEPSKIIKAVDKKAILKKVESMKNMINHALSDNCDLECAENVKMKILKSRQAGLVKNGEYSVENLAFKELRRTKDIDRLIQGVTAKRDAELSLKQETFKMYTGLPGMGGTGKGSRGPRHRGLTAGASKLTKDPSTVKSVKVVAAMHTDMESPFNEVENIKKKERGKAYLTPQIASSIARWYNLNFEKVLTEPRGLSTSGIVLGYDPSVKKYYLKKGK
jgi:predicted nucleotidyltransferase